MKAVNVKLSLRIKPLSKPYVYLLRLIVESLFSVPPTVQDNSVLLLRLDPLISVKFLGKTLS